MGTISSAYIKTYYILLLYIVSSLPIGYLQYDFKDIHAYGFLNILPSSWLSISGAFYIHIAAIIFCALSIFFNSKILRFCTFFTFVTFVSYRFAISSFGGNLEIWMWSSFFLVFYDANRPMYDYKNQVSLYLTKAYILSAYFTAGIWKIGTYLASDNLSWYEYSTNKIYMIFADFKYTSPIVLKFYELWPQLIVLGMCLVLIVQISSIIPMVLNRYFTFWGILLAGFHIMSHIFLGVHFPYATLAILFFLVLGEMVGHIMHEEKANAS